MRRLKFDSESFFYYLVQAGNFANAEIPFFDNCLESLLLKVSYKVGNGPDNY